MSDKKLAIVGSREYKNYEHFKSIVNSYINEIGMPDIIISGGANGVDAMAALYANEIGVKLIVFTAEWSKYGLSAGPKRNTLIITTATHVLALPASNSRSTYDAISKAIIADKIIKIVKI